MKKVELGKLLMVNFAYLIYFSHFCNSITDYGLANTIRYT